MTVEQPLPMFDDEPPAPPSPKKPKPKPGRRKPVHKRKAAAPVKVVKKRRKRRVKKAKPDLAKAGARGKLSEKLSPAQLETAWMVMALLQKHDKDERAFILTAVQALYA